MESRESRGYECDYDGFTPSSNESRESRPSRACECDDDGFTLSSNESRESRPSRDLNNYNYLEHSEEKKPLYIRGKENEDGELDLIITSKSGKDRKEIDETGPVQYNDLEEIDSLIQKLSDSLEEDRPINRRINDALEKRKIQIQQLKELREEIKRNKLREKKLEEEAISLEKENAEIDKKIKMLKRRFIK